MTIKERRRGSISISRVGDISSLASSLGSRASSTRGSRSSSIVLTKPAFYQLDRRTHAHAHAAPAAHDSTDSFASDLSDPSLDGAAEETMEEEHHVAQTHFIPAQSLSRAISRRLSRARDVLPLAGSPAPAAALVIGVAVEANVVEHHHSHPHKAAH